jgi:hypothetical protein
MITVAQGVATAPRGLARVDAVPDLSSDRVLELITLAGGRDAPGTAALLHAVEAVSSESPAVAAVVRCLARAGVDGHTVLPQELVAEMLAGLGASGDQAAQAIGEAVDGGHVLAFEQHDEPAGDTAADVPVLLALADIGMAEEAVAEALLHLVAAGDVRFADLTHGGDVSAGHVVDLRTADVVHAAALLERAADTDTLTLVGDSALPPPSGPGQVAADLFAAAAQIGLKVSEQAPDSPPGAVIAQLCAGIRAGTLSRVDDPTREVVVIRAADGAEAAHRARQLVTDSLPRALNLTGDDVVVVTPVRRGPAGAETLRAAGLPAVTVREAIGRTWPGVVAVLPPEGCGVLSRPLVYAMFSRATRHLSVVHAAGPGLATAVRETAARPRRTRLPALLRQES